jgi:hypothetical protein
MTEEEDKVKNSCVGFAMADILHTQVGEPRKELLMMTILGFLKRNFYVRSSVNIF